MTKYEKNGGIIMTAKLKRLVACHFANIHQAAQDG